MRDPRPARVVLPVALFPVPPWCNPRSFRVNFRAYNYLRTTGTRLRSQYTSGFRLRNHFRSVSFHFRSIQDGARGRHGSRTASGSRKNAWDPCGERELYGNTNICLFCHLVKRPTFLPTFLRLANLRILRHYYAKYLNFTNLRYPLLLLT